MNGGLAPWHWLTLGVVLVIVEVFAPGFFFVWLGASALVVGLVVWLLPDLSWQIQILAFATLGLVSAVGWLFLQRRFAARGEPLSLNRRAEQLVGREFRLVQPIAGGRGRIRVGDTVWPVEGPDLPLGARVRVLRAEGTTLIVEPAEEPARPGGEAGAG